MTTKEVLRLFLVKAQIDMVELSLILHASAFLTHTAYSGGTLGNEFSPYLQDNTLSKIEYLKKMIQFVRSNYSENTLNKFFRLNFRVLGKVSIVTYLKMHCKDEHAARVIYNLLVSNSLK